MIRNRASRAVGFALITLLGACSSDSTIGPNTRPPADLKQVLGEMTLPSLSGLAGTAVPFAVAFSAPTPSNCTYSSASQSFVCPTVTANGITLTESYTLFDASGRPQAAFDPSTTAAIRTKTTLSGSISEGGGTISMDQTQELTLSGLLTGNHVMNGTSTMRMVMPGPGSQPYTMTMTSSIVNLTVPAGTTGASTHPASGSITMDISSTGGGTPLSTTHMEMTFNGTSRVTVVITSSGITTRCTVDLANPTSACS